MGMWQGISGPLKRFSGASGTVSLKKGTIILNCQVVSGTCSGFPNGVGGTITLTGPVNVDPKHEGIVCLADTTLTFSAAFYVEAESKDGF